MCYPHTIYANGVNITGKMKVYKDNNVNMVMAKIIKSDGEEVELGTIKNMSESARKCIYESSDNGTTVNISAEYCYDGIDNRTIICNKINDGNSAFNSSNCSDNSISANSNQFGFNTSDETHLNNCGGK